MADRRDLLEIGRDQHDGLAAGELGGEQPVDLGLGADIDAGRRVLEDQHLGRDVHPARDDDLLLIAAGEAFDELVRRVRHEADAPPGAGAGRGLRRGMAPREECQAQRPQIDEHVLADRQARRDRFGDAVGGDEAEPALHRVMDRRIVERPALDGDRAGGARLGADERAADDLWPAPRSPTRPSTSPRRTLKETGPTAPIPGSRSPAPARLRARWGRRRPPNSFSGGRPMIARTSSSDWPRWSAAGRPRARRAAPAAGRRWRRPRRADARHRSY